MRKTNHLIFDFSSNDSDYHEEFDYNDNHEILTEEEEREKKLLDVGRQKTIN